jgi:hypothetical protein
MTALKKIIEFQFLIGRLETRKEPLRVPVFKDVSIPHR